MGSFYVNCSITNKTISDDDDMVVQFMVPAKWGQYCSEDKTESYNNLTISLFLSMVKMKGLEEAMKEHQVYLTEKNDDDFLAPKGLIVSDSVLSNWVPIGPAIRGKYDDYGYIAPSDDEENVERIKVLESIFYGVPFKSIMKAATDDRWFRLGKKENKDNWKVEGLDNNLSDEAMMLFKNLSITYMHQSVYDEIKRFDFCSEEGVMKDDYSEKWKNEYINSVRENFVDVLKTINEPYLRGDNSEEFIMSSLVRWKSEEKLGRVGIISNLPDKIKQEYFIRLQTIIDATDFEWFFETITFIYGLTGLGIQLNQSFYGSQYRNWKGWKRIESALNLILNDIITKEENEEQ